MLNWFCSISRKVYPEFMSSVTSSMI
jgi:hypothetical protein